MRLRTSARALDSATLRELARLAHEHGNGIIELTRRANLQLRGLRLDSQMPELLSQLIALGLVDASPAREARPALLVDPLAAVDLAELASMLDVTLAEFAADGGKVSPKLGIVLDAGSGSVSSVEADIRIVARGAAPHVHVYVAQELVVACERAAARAVLRKLLDEFAAVDGTRMRDLVAARGLAGLRAALAPLAAASPASAANTTVSSSAPPSAAIGFHGEWFGVAVPFGSATHEQWSAIAELAERFACGEVRFSPAREVLIPGVRSEHAAALADAARALGLIVEASDPRRRILACSGAPACSSAYGETRALASQLAAQAAPLLAAGATLHVSGCEKGCASRAVSELNVVLAPDGHARLALNSDITATSSAAPLPLAVVSKRLATLSASSTTST